LRSSHEFWKCKESDVSREFWVWDDTYNAEKSNGGEEFCSVEIFDGDEFCAEEFLDAKDFCPEEFLVQINLEFGMKSAMRNRWS
jgi:hypothetical protein